ncbi:U2 snRNP component prp10, partial [Coemansia sp. RSA 2424]
MTDNLKAQLEAERRKRKELSDAATAIKFDTDIYGTGNDEDKFAGYDTSIATTSEYKVPASAAAAGGRFGITAPRELIDELSSAEAQNNNGDDDPFKDIQRERGTSNRVIADRESDYQKQRHGRQLSADRIDAFSGKDGGGGGEGLTYSEAMRKNQLDREKADLLAKISKKMAQDKSASAAEQQQQQQQQQIQQRPKRQWDVETPVHPTMAAAAAPSKRNRWDQTPADVGTAPAATPRRNRWDETPKAEAISATPRRSRWDETPKVGMASAGNMGFGATPAGNIGFGATPAPSMAAQLQPDAMDARNAFQTDAELDALLPKDGYAIMEPPPTYTPIRTPARKLMATPAAAAQHGFLIPEESRHAHAEIASVGALPFFKQEDMAFFGRLLDGQRDDDMGAEERRERQVLRLLLKIKNGTAAERKTAMRQLGERARALGAAAVFGQTLPLLMAAGLEEQERHVLAKAVDRALLRLGDQARPFAHKILVVVEPMLIDADRFARAE